MKTDVSVLIKTRFQSVFLALMALVSMNTFSGNTSFASGLSESYVDSTGYVLLRNTEYIRQYSANPALPNDQNYYVGGDITSYNQLLKEVNDLSEIKVHVLLINGISFAKYNALPQNATTVTDVLNWSAPSLEKDPVSEAKQIVERIAASESKGTSVPIVFCAIVDMDVLYSTSRGEKLVVYHTVDNGLVEDKGIFVTQLNSFVESEIKKKRFSTHAPGNLSVLISLIRQQQQNYLVQNQTNTTLSTHLLSINDPLIMSVEIGKIGDEVIMAFEDNVRGHVVSTLMRVQAPNLYAIPDSYPNQQVPGFQDRVLRVLKNVPDARAAQWLQYLRSSNGKSTLLRSLIANFFDSMLGRSYYLELIQVFNKQLRLDPEFQQRVDDLLQNERFYDRVILWDKSYAMKLFTTPPIGTHKYNVKSVTENVEFTKTRVSGWSCSTRTMAVSMMHTTTYESCSAVWDSEQQYSLNPFDLVLFVNRSDLSLLAKATSQDGNALVVPAIYLKYADDKSWNSNVAAGLSMGVDVVTLAIPISKLAYGPKLMRYAMYGAELADKTGAIASLSASLGVVDGKYAEIAKCYSNITTIISLGPFAYQAAHGIKDLAAYVRAVRMREEELLRHVGSSEEIKYVLDLKNKIDQEAVHLRGANWVDDALGALPPDPMLHRIDRLNLSSLRKQYNALDDKLKSDFLSDFGSLGDDVLRRFDTDELAIVDSWKVFKNANLGDEIRKNPTNLESLSRALKQNGYNASYFETLLKSKADPQKFLNDYVSKIGANGKFVDDALESDYIGYTSRKAKEGKPPRDRADWNEASDYMKYDSPTARGNNFNRKAWDEEWYPYWEVYLDNGKYLDGYNPLTKEVVSRKATDLIDISEAKFVKYLDEILEKYAPPRIIKSKKPGYESLFDKPLPSDAKLILEIPESNKTFFDIDRYIVIAQKKGITLKFMPE